ncbi:unnamed protein product [Arctia plantaginis]|uniref:Nucleoporin NUP42 n=1 Tax=Arctia plantaginis TaxID=874455 RepID=A0A8S1B1S1_ARCPL|nr:unnamed protein product [Arctia plantaginis]
MTVCRFFQQGYCRYGQNCRYDHIYGSKYSYHANPQPQAAPPQSSISDEQLVSQVQADMQSALRGGQWILSCYSPFKEKPIFPGINDLSPEEARLFIYEAKNSNNLEQAITYMNNIFKETKQKYEQILQPDMNIIKVLRGLYKGEVLPSPFTSNNQNAYSSGSNTASSIFRSALQNTQSTSPTANTAKSIFSQGQQSIFNTQPDPAMEIFSRANANVFGPSSPPNAFGENQNISAKSLFASAVQSNPNQASPSNIFASANQSIFGSPPNQNTSPFVQVQKSPFSQEQSTSPFAPVQSKSPFSQEQSNSPFAPVQNTSPFGQGNIFQKNNSPASIFGQANKQLISDDPGVYSKKEELSETDLEAFKSDKFELGFVPELPPPYQLCTRAL